MRGVALKMLFGDPVKYAGLVFGVAFATLLIMQQSSIFVRLMARTASVIVDVQEADLWVMDPGVRYLETIRAMRDTEVGRVRGVEGVLWAVPLFKSQASLRTAEGGLDNGILVGVDDATLIGLPQEFVLGSPAALRRPDAIAIDRAGFMRLWPGEPLRLGKELELNDRRAVIAAITEAKAPFTAQPVLHARYATAVSFVPTGRNRLSFVLARAAPGTTPEAVAARIAERTGLAALTDEQFFWKTIGYYLANTGIPVNFGATIALGLIVGIAIVGLTLSMFIKENLRQYAALKAIGLTNGRLVAMVLLQAGVVGIAGYGIGMGLAATFFEVMAVRSVEFRGFYMPWWIATGTFAATLVIVLAASLASLRRILVVDPAQVFRG